MMMLIIVMVFVKNRNILVDINNETLNWIFWTGYMYL